MKKPIKNHWILSTAIAASLAPFSAASATIFSPVCLSDPLDTMGFDCLLVDNFDTPGTIGGISATSDGSFSSSQNAAPEQTIGGSRDYTLSNILGANLINTATISAGTGNLSWSNAASVSSDASVSWNAAALNIQTDELLPFNEIVIDVESIDLAADFSISVSAVSESEAFFAPILAPSQITPGLLILPFDPSLLVGNVPFFLSDIELQFFSNGEDNIDAVFNYIEFRRPEAMESTAEPGTILSLLTIGSIGFIFRRFRQNSV
ncbi:hypothetical protein [Cyanothece sp. BG0011]|uniref:hypothetical protein n=1 Tax=Cyanothece sp. BG0011 TaxID=2082950 RepID=UPI000D1E942B|nr:hypothetical protein [Cyanothece sp. BG0011]